MVLIPRLTVAYEPLPSQLSDIQLSNSRTQTLSDSLLQKLPSSRGKPRSTTCDDKETSSSQLLRMSKFGPMLRQNGTLRWPHGVISGGVVIDMLECFSATNQMSDYELVQWLQAHYIEPFGRIERLDGLVITDKKDM